MAEIECAKAAPSRH